MDVRVKDYDAVVYFVSALVDTVGRDGAEEFLMAALEDVDRKEEFQSTMRKRMESKQSGFKINGVDIGNPGLKFSKEFGAILYNEDTLKSIHKAFEELIRKTHFGKI